MTPACVISWYRSLPSRVRSPTPANTDTPPCSFATLLMSSMMTTVLPTPAPPNAPILPPFRNGQMRSMTLIPVDRTCGDVDCSASGGGRALVDRVPRHVERSPHDAIASLQRDPPATIPDLLPALEALGTGHGD